MRDQREKSKMRDRQKMGDERNGGAERPERTNHGGGREGGREERH